MAILWSKDLETGVVAIDNQHKELFARVNRLLEACIGGKGIKEVRETLDFLANYVIEHFEAEERVMRRSNYPGYHMHKQLHNEFRAEVERLMKEIEEEGVGSFTVVKVNQIVVGWLNNHIRRVDRVMAQALRKEFTELTLVR